MDILKILEKNFKETREKHKRNRRRIFKEILLILREHFWNILMESLKQLTRNCGENVILEKL